MIVLYVQETRRGKYVYTQINQVGYQVRSFDIYTNVFYIFLLKHTIPN